ncbi:MAG: cytochrome [Bacteroidota bacterium]|nr:cytochrome [Bacteroidota bacterium]
MKLPKIATLPVIGNAPEISKDILSFLGNHFSKKGDTFSFKLPLNKSVVATCDPVVFKHILQLNHKNYRKDYGGNLLKLALGNGLLTSEGESWFKQRRLAQPAFYKKRLEGFFDTMNSMTLEYVSRLKERNAAHIYIDTEMMQLTSRVVIETLLGSDVSDKLTNIQNYIYFIQAHVVKMLRIPFYNLWAKVNGTEKQFDDTLRMFDHILYEIINKRKDQPPKNDLLSMLMDARDEDTGEGMSDKQLRDELLTIYLAGHETSGYTLAWAMYNLCMHPEAYKKAKEELRSVMTDGKLTIENYKQLVYLKCVIDETLRLYPTAYILTRESKEVDMVKDLEIPSKTLIVLSTYFLHRNPAYWQKPDEFIPERFEGTNNPLLNSDAYYPFGGGPRMCIGFYFATMEITIVLAQLLYHFDFELDKGHEVAFEPLVTLKPKYGIKLKLKTST